MRDFYIYKVTNLVNGKSYVGQHRIPLNDEPFNRYYGRGIAIREAIKEYGRNNFYKEILEYLKDDDNRKLVSERERYWIEKENTMIPNGYNIVEGGFGGINSEVGKRSANTRRINGYVMPEEVKQKISKSNKNKSKSEEHKKHLSENHHLKTLHKILHEDGTIEETYLAMNKIAKKYNTTQNTLLRHSVKKQFINGIYLLDIDVNKYECCNYSKDKEKRKVLCYDPVQKGTCTLCALRLRKSRNKELYKDVVLTECILKGDQYAIRTNY